MSYEEYGPLACLVGKWASEKWTGENQAPDPNRGIENTKFRQEMTFEPIGDIKNHEQILYALRYMTLAFEEGSDDDPFHHEVGYFIWDADRKQVLKTFVLPRGIAVNAGGTTDPDSKEFSLSAKVGSETYGVTSNPFLDEEFKTLSYDVTFKIVDDNTLSYDENTRIQIKNQDQVFDHTEKNTLFRV